MHACMRPSLCKYKVEIIMIGDSLFGRWRVVDNRKIRIQDEGER